jgi:hypothetical protein
MEGNNEGNSAPEVKTKVAPSGNDWFLQQFVARANHEGLELGITLQTGGFLVSGILISGHAYLEQISALLLDAFVDEGVKQHYRDAMSYLAEHMKSKNAEDIDLSPAFIHLREAKLIQAGGPSIPRNQPVLWRGRISEVSGFFLGQVEQTATG